MMTIFENKNTDFSVCGIDEAGRGPLAGPLVMAGVILNKEIDGLDDSKKLTVKKRENLYPLIVKNSKYYISIIDNCYIDEKGISSAIRTALNEIMQELDGEDIFFLFDGNSSFGIDRLSCMVKADTKIQQVSAASILAKVTRDRMMIEYAKDYPDYGFDKHKGYGTKAHIEAIKRYGYSPIHRKSYKIKGLD